MTIPRIALTRAEAAARYVVASSDAAGAAPTAYRDVAA